MIAIASIISFWMLVLGGLTFYSGRSKEEEILRERMERLVKGKEVVQDNEVQLDAGESPAARRLKSQLHLLGLNRKSDLKKAILFRRVCYISPFLISAALFFMGFPMLETVLLGIVFGVIFILIPKIWMIRLRIQRKKEIEKHLPDTLDLLTLCLEAGLSFDSSLVRVAEEQRRSSPHISREFLMTNQEILTGRSRKCALDHLADRVEVDEVRSLVGAIQQSIKLGTSLVKTLRTQATVTRKKKREQIRAAIMKTPVKLIFPLIFLIFPTLMIVILAPSLVNTFRHLAAVQ